MGSFFETDLFRPILDRVQSLSGKRYGADERDDVSIRIVGEHARATAFLVADGVQPSNEGRGYVLRRMLRRVVSHARRLGIEGPVMAPLVEVVQRGFGDAYPELRENLAFVEQVTSNEEERFASTLRQGVTLFEEAKGRAVEGRFSGDDAFQLKDTFGFPLELTLELAEDAGLTVDTDRFDELLREQRERSRRDAKKVPIGLDSGAVPPTEFVGYEQPEAEGPVVALLDRENRELDVAEEGQEVRIFLARTPFYAEAGGQVGDQGEIRTQTGSIRVLDTQWAGPDAIMHVGVVGTGEVHAGQDAIGEIDRLRREATARAHTSTHVVHWTLKHLLGEHARQAGSLVAPGRLRFDFPHPQGVPTELLQEAELEANRRLARDDAVHIFETSMDEAKALGAVALFGEKYGDVVRVVEVGDYSRELCGGTHVARTGNIAVIRILGEGSIGAGMRRVEALVGPDALREINAERELLRSLVDALGSKDPQAAVDHARRVVEENKRLKNELGALRAGDRGSQDRRASWGGRRRSTASCSSLRKTRVRTRAGCATSPRRSGTSWRPGPPRSCSAAVREAGRSSSPPARPPRSRGGSRRPPSCNRGEERSGGGAGGKDILAMAGGTRRRRRRRGARGRSPRGSRSCCARSDMTPATSPLGRVLGLDLGDARIGVAISDPERRHGASVRHDPCGTAARRAEGDRGDRARSRRSQPSCWGCRCRCREPRVRRPGTRRGSHRRSQALLDVPIAPAGRAAQHGGGGAAAIRPPAWEGGSAGASWTEPPRR